MLKGCSQTICTAQYEMHRGLLVAAVANQSSYPTSCHFKLCLHPNCLGCVCQWNFFPKKRGEQWQSVLTKEGRAFCRCSSTTPKLQQALISQPYSGLVELCLQFTVQNGSSRQDKTKVKCTQGYIADLGKLLQLKLIWCGISPCHLCITVLPGYRVML